MGDQIEIDIETAKIGVMCVPRFRSSSFPGIRKGSSAPLPPSHLYCAPGDEVIRKIPSTIVATGSSGQVSGQAIANRIIQHVDSQGPGQAEYEYQIQHRDPNSGIPYKSEHHIYRKNY